MRDKYLPLVEKIRARKLFFFLMALFFLIAMVLFVKNLLVSFILAFVMFFLLNPLVDYLERRGFGRLSATLIPFAGMTLAAAILMPLFIPTLVGQFDSLRTDFPKYLGGITGLITEIQTRYSGFFSSVYKTDIAIEAQEKITIFAQNIFKELPEHISNSLTVLFLSPFLAFFMLLDGRELVRKLLALVPNNFFELVLNLNYQISTQMGGFVRARLLESIIVGLVLWIGLIIIGFPYALVLALVGGLLNLIPYLGPIIGAVPAFLIALINGVSPSEYLSLCMVYASAQIVDIVFVIPFVVAKIVDLHPVTVVLAVLIGAQVMGILGMIISIPLASTLKVTFSAVYRHLTEFRD
jgi:putative permease